MTLFFNYSYLHLFWYSFIHLFIYYFIHYFFHSFVRLLVRSFVHSFVRSFARSFIHSFIRSSVNKVKVSGILSDIKSEDSSADIKFYPLVNGSVYSCAISTPRRAYNLAAHLCPTRYSFSAGSDSGKTLCSTPLPFAR